MPMLCNFVNRQMQMRCPARDLISGTSIIGDDLDWPLASDVVWIAGTQPVDLVRVQIVQGRVLASIEFVHSAVQKSSVGGEGITRSDDAFWCTTMWHAEAEWLALVREEVHLLVASRG